ncbi:hypothetical protein BC351_16755 [Paenibacillus ferrarius]|uniref:DUF4227 domain-containing protein n=1 Tax=Paenibacillus ferrarius TaxID=1469647 RepID=A0A1V4HQW1_9BACL|nr:DUF4227 family protein [Paenibacillus ferrarius]OPH60845.1 hypothetical protein BC351_16755 [Paenibacillus ferrarius]
MIFSYRKLLVRLRYILLFMALTVILYQVMLVLTGWIEPVNKYRTPSGRSVKVFGQHDPVSLKETGTMSDRLRLFYWYGE